MNWAIKLAIMTIATCIGLLYIVYLGIGIARGTETSIGRIQEGECGLALAELSVEITTNKKRWDLFRRLPKR